jgi:hypothetical protein
MGVSLYSYVYDCFTGQRRYIAMALGFDIKIILLLCIS